MKNHFAHQSALILILLATLCPLNASAKEKDKVAGKANAVASQGGNVDIWDVENNYVMFTEYCVNAEAADSRAYELNLQIERIASGDSRYIRFSSNSANVFRIGKCGTTRISPSQYPN